MVKGEYFTDLHCIVGLAVDRDQYWPALSHYDSPYVYEFFELNTEYLEENEWDWDFTIVYARSDLMWWKYKAVNGNLIHKIRAKVGEWLFRNIR